MHSLPPDNIQKKWLRASDSEQKKKWLSYDHFPFESNIVFWKDLMTSVSYRLKLIYDLALWLWNLLQHQIFWQ